ncbi:hypothetical protein DSECCO2_585910 [anaerobic digester metagenome]
MGRLARVRCVERPGLGLFEDRAGAVAHVGVAGVQGPAGGEGEYAGPPAHLLLLEPLREAQVARLGLQPLLELLLGVLAAQGGLGLAAESFHVFLVLLPHGLDVSGALLPFQRFGHELRAAVRTALRLGRYPGPALAALGRIGLEFHTALRAVLGHLRYKRTAVAALHHAPEPHLVQV